MSRLSGFLGFILGGKPDAFIEGTKVAGAGEPFPPAARPADRRGRRHAMKTQIRRQTPRRSKQPGDRRPNRSGKWKDQRRGTRAFTSWVSEARVTPAAQFRRKHSVGRRSAA